MIAMVYDHSHPTELLFSHVQWTYTRKVPPVLETHRFDLRLPFQAFLVKFNENFLADWKQKRLTNAGVSSFPTLRPSYVNLNVPTKKK